MKQLLVAAPLAGLLLSGIDAVAAAYVKGWSTPAGDLFWLFVVGSVWALLLAVVAGGTARMLISNASARMPAVVGTAAVAGIWTLSLVFEVYERTGHASATIVPGLAGGLAAVGVA